jgi:hypothetical protein
MAKIAQRPTIGLELVIVLDEEETRALDALVGYGDDAFIEAFKEKLGHAYLDDHEDGLRRFFQSIRQNVPLILDRLKKAKEAFNATSSQLPP